MMIATCIHRRLWWLWVILGHIVIVASTFASQTIEVAEGPGEFVSPSSKCLAAVEISAMGGHRVLSIRRDQKRIYRKIDDMTGLAWLPDDRLVYSTSPIYGKPGLFMLDCATGRVSRLVAPRSIVKGYPDGADYFALHSVRGEKQFEVSYYYVENIDTTQGELKQDRFLRRVIIRSSQKAPASN